MANECNSGFCAQGRCCDSACNGTCKTCALATALGTCSNVPNGTAPVAASQCVAHRGDVVWPRRRVQRLGRLPLLGGGARSVLPGSCTGSTLIPARTCDGAGACRTVTSSLCDPYQCASATACKTSCTTGRRPTAWRPNSCISMSCGKLPIGAACTMAASATRTSARRACAARPPARGTARRARCRPRSGTCTSVPAGQDPLNQCTDQGVAMCGNDGTCNGSGVCRRYASGVTCVAASCPNTATVQPRVDLQRERHLRDAGDHAVRAVRLQRGRVQDQLREQRRLPGTDVRVHGHDVQLRDDASRCSSQASRATRQTTRTISADFQLSQQRDDAVPLSELTLRYWYTYDRRGRRADRQVRLRADAGGAGASSPSAHCRQPGRAPTPTTTFSSASPPAAGNLDAGREHGHIQTRFTRTTSATTTRPTTTRTSRRRRSASRPR